VAVVAEPAVPEAAAQAEPEPTVPIPLPAVQLLAPQQLLLPLLGREQHRGFPCLADRVSLGEVASRAFYGRRRSAQTTMPPLVSTIPSRRLISLLLAFRLPRGRVHRLCRCACRGNTCRIFCECSEVFGKSESTGRPFSMFSGRDSSWRYRTWDISSYCIRSPFGRIPCISDIPELPLSS